MKPNQNTTESGFTIIELIVVIALMAVLATLVLVNFAQQRSTRSVVLAQNETVTNIRKVQSYALSSRQLPNGLSARYYIVTFWKNYPNYHIQAIDENGSFYGASIENIKLPQDVAISQIRRLDGTVKTIDCAQIVFAIPFGQMYAIDNGECDDTIESIVADPIALDATKNRTVELTLTNTKTGAGKSVTMYGLTGRIEGN